MVAGLIGLALALAAIPDRGLGQAPHAGAPGPSYIRFRMIRIMDQHGFHQPVEAYRVLVPSNWQAQGSVRWRPEIVSCPTHPIEASLRAVAPDGITGIEIFPINVWRWMDDPESRQIAMRGGGCPWLGVLSAPDYLRAVLPRVRPGAQIVSAVPDQRLAAAIDAQLRAYLEPFFRAGFVKAARVDAGKFHVRYLMNGQPVDDLLTGVLKITTQESPSYSQVAQGYGRPLTTFSVLAEPWMSARAPQGQLDPLLPVFGAVIASITPNLVLVQAVQTVSNNIGQARQRGDMDRQRIWHESQQEIGRIYTQTWARQQQVQSSLAQQFSESVRGIETFVDRITGERVELAGGYRQAWTNGRGEYILSNDPNFDPGVALRERWDEMPRVGRQ